MLETVKENRSSDFSFTDYLEQEIDTQMLNIKKTIQLKIDNENSGIQGLIKKNASFSNLVSQFEDFTSINFDRRHKSKEYEQNATKDDSDGSPAKLLDIGNAKNSC
jgi:hypothetical protein